MRCALIWMKSLLFLNNISPRKIVDFAVSAIGLLRIFLDRAFKGGYNFILDGTFAGAKAIDNVRRAIRHGYLVYIVVLIEDAEQAKEYTRIRKEKTKREIKDEAFTKTILGIKKNLKIIQSEFVDKGLPVAVKFIKKHWQNSTVSYKITWSNIDDLYKK